MTTLSAQEVTSALSDLPGWSGSIEAIECTFEAPDFATGIGLVAGAAAIAEQLDHHPDIDIRWTRVKFALSTHSAGGVTDLDLQLAQGIQATAEDLGCR